MQTVTDHKETLCNSEAIDFRLLVVPLTFHFFFAGYGVQNCRHFQHGYNYKCI